MRKVSEICRGTEGLVIKSMHSYQGMLQPSLPASEKRSCATRTDIVVAGACQPCYDRNLRGLHKDRTADSRIFRRCVSLPMLLMAGKSVLAQSMTVQSHGGALHTKDLEGE